MVPAIQELPGKERHGARYTGFPEPLSLDRNTTWAHPDADTSQSATLESADLQLSRTNSRIRSLTHRSHSGASKRPHVHGRLDTTLSTTLARSNNSSQLILDPKDMYKDIVYEDGSKELGDVGKNGELKTQLSSADSGVGMERSEKLGDVTSGDVDSVIERKKRSIFGKLHKNKS